jgi:hypothetical protein
VQAKGSREFFKGYLYLSHMVAKAEDAEKIGGVPRRRNRHSDVFPDVHTGYGVCVSCSWLFSPLAAASKKAGSVDRGWILPGAS